jgi:Ca2+-binding EF-hand superfamily protein
VVECTLLQRQLGQFRAVVDKREEEIGHLYKENETMRAREDQTREKAAGAAIEMLPRSEEEVEERRAEEERVLSMEPEHSRAGRARASRLPKDPWRDVVGSADGGRHDGEEGGLPVQQRGLAEVKKLQKLREVFDGIDKDENGFVSRRNLILALNSAGGTDSELCQMLGVPPHIRQEVGIREAFEQIFQHADEGNTGQLSWGEFVRCAFGTSGIEQEMEYASNESTGASTSAGMRTSVKWAESVTTEGTPAEHGAAAFEAVASAAAATAASSVSTVYGGIGSTIGSNTDMDTASVEHELILQQATALAYQVAKAVGDPHHDSAGAGGGHGRTWPSALRQNRDLGGGIFIRSSPHMGLSPGSAVESPFTPAYNSFASRYSAGAHSSRGVPRTAFSGASGGLVGSHDSPWATAYSTENALTLGDLAANGEQGGLRGGASLGRSCSASPVPTSGRGSPNRSRHGPSVGFRNAQDIVRSPSARAKPPASPVPPSSVWR